MDVRPVPVHKLQSNIADLGFQSPSAVGGARETSECENVCVALHVAVDVGADVAVLIYENEDVSVAVDVSCKQTFQGGRQRRRKIQSQHRDCC